MQKICIECNSPFNNTTPCNIWVDIRGRKKCWNCKPYNSGNRKALIDREFKICARCNIELPIANFYFRSNSGKRTRIAYCNTCLKEYNKERELSIKIQLIKLSGGCCQECGYKKNVYALDFHHRDPNEKQFNLAHTSGITDIVLAEIKKCDLLCSNCHREHHHPTTNYLL